MATVVGLVLSARAQIDASIRIPEAAEPNAIDANKPVTAHRLSEAGVHADEHWLSGEPEHREAMGAVIRRKPMSGIVNLMGDVGRQQEGLPIPTFCDVVMHADFEE